METVVSNARSADIEELGVLWHQAWHGAHADFVPPELTSLRTLPSFIDRLKLHLDSTRVCRGIGQILGFCMTRENEIFQIYVTPAAKGKGVATSLMIDAESIIRARPHSRAWLVCVAENTRAVKFYEKCGWKVVKAQVENLETSAGDYPLPVWRFEKSFVTGT